MYNGIFETLSTLLTDQELVRPIKHFIECYSRLQRDAPDNFGTWVPPTLVDQPLSWPVVKWTEGEKEVFAIFKLVPGKPVYSTLVHYGVKMDQSVAPKWSNSCLSWMVWDIKDLRNLFGVVNQALSALYFDREMVEGFFDPNRTECSVEELVPQYVI
jgi:hypothetical protein